MAFSSAGWIKEAEDANALTEADPTDNLKEWEGLEIYDSSGQKCIVQKVWRVWPRQAFGVWLCRSLNNATYVDFELSVPVQVSFDELKQRLRAEYTGCDGIEEAESHYELIQMFV